MKDRTLETVRAAHFYGEDKRVQVIFDFADDWHFAATFIARASRVEVAEELRRLAHIIDYQIKKDKENDAAAQ